MKSERSDLCTRASVRWVVALGLLLGALPGCGGSHAMLEVNVVGLDAAVESVGTLVTLNGVDSVPVLPTSRTRFTLQLPENSDRGTVQVFVSGFDSAPCTVSRGDSTLALHGPGEYAVTVTMGRVPRQC